MVECRVRFFEPARVRGVSIDEKIKNLRATAEKVVSDSKSDNSRYRRDYSKAHEELLIRISDGYTKERIYSFYAWHSSASLDGATLKSNPGRYDAFGRILAELKFIFGKEITYV